MVKINKTYPAPAPINREKDYQGGLVFDTICSDFHKKCYLCEAKPISINIEHIVPHKSDETLKFKWENLFYACVHCNSIKGTKYDNILDCTKDDPEENIVIKYDPFPNKKPEFESKDKSISPQVDSTIKLLEEIVCSPPTDQKREGAKNLCKKLYNEVTGLVDKLEEYFNAVDNHHGEDEEKYLKQCVARCIYRSSPFAAFKRAIIRKIPEYYDIFKSELEK